MRRSVICAELLLEEAREDVDALEHVVHRRIVAQTDAAIRASGDEPLIERSSMKMASNF